MRIEKQQTFFEQKIFSDYLFTKLFEAIKLFYTLNMKIIRNSVN